jgi:glycosyltransferase involved in cell wall biosynthesis
MNAVARSLYGPPPFWSEGIQKARMSTTDPFGQIEADVSAGSGPAEAMNMILDKALNARIGIIARCDNTGLGVMTVDFFRNLTVQKVLVVPGTIANYLDRFANRPGVSVIVCPTRRPTLGEINRFLEDIDVVVAFETPYDWNIFMHARQLGIKTVLVPMYEWTPPNDKIPCYPDLFLCPSRLDYDELPEPKQYIPTPVNRDIIPFRLRTQAGKFVFINGMGGFKDRNSLRVLLELIPLVKSPVEFLIRSQVSIPPISDTRVTVQMEEVDYGNLWKEGDIYLHLHRWDGLSLPINEAMAAGMPIVAPNFYPHNEFLPKRLLFPIEATVRECLSEGFREIDVHVISASTVAQKIDEVAAMQEHEIALLSQAVNQLADERSWSVLRSKFVEILNNLIKS